MNQANWKSKSLGDLSTFRSGGTPSKSNPKFWDGDIPWVTAKDMKTPTISNSINQLTIEGRKVAKLTPENTLLILVRGMTLHKDIPLAITEKELAFNQDIKALTTCDEILPKFLMIYLFSQKHQILKLVDSAGHGTGRLDTEILKSFLVKYPSILEQKEIVDVFSSWDSAIEKTEALIAAKEKQFEWLTHTIIRENCPHWKHYLAKELFSSVSSKGHPGEELLSVTQDRGVIPRSMLKGRVMSPAGSTAGYKLVEKGNFVISLRSFQGGLEYSDYRGIVSPAYTVLSSKKEINADFYCHFFKSYIFVEKYLSVAVIGIRDGKQISSTDFDTVKIPYPDMEEQVAIAKKLDTARQEINLLKDLLEKYRLQKIGLMQKLLTGEWQVDVTSQAAEEACKEVSA